MKITREELIAIIREDTADWDELDCDMVGQRRWVTEYEGIYKHVPSGKIYRICYDSPSTESSGDLEDVIWGDTEAVEVVESTKTVKYWKAI